MEILIDVTVQLNNEITESEFQDKFIEFIQLMNSDNLIAGSISEIKKQIVDNPKLENKYKYFNDNIENLSISDLRLIFDQINLGFFDEKSTEYLIKQKFEIEKNKQLITIRSELLLEIRNIINQKIKTYLKNE